MNPQHFTVVIMRGIPGSGKSAVAKAIAAGVNCIASADHYFEKKGRFRAAELQEAHDSCKARFTELLEKKERMVIVDNTNVKKRDFIWYEREASRHRYAVVYVVMAEMNPEICYKRNQHQVPFDTIKRMSEEFER